MVDTLGPGRARRIDTFGLGGARRFDILAFGRARRFDTRGLKNNSPRICNQLIWGNPYTPQDEWPALRNTTIICNPARDRLPTVGPTRNAWPGTILTKNIFMFEA